MILSASLGLREERTAREVRRIKVISKKYDNSLRNEYEAFLYSREDETITLLSPAGTRYYDHRQEAWFEAPDGLLEIYFQDRWYNVWHICEQNSHRNLIYANLCMPAALHGNVLEWIDLDLDFRVHMDGSIELLDEAEFERNISQFGYPGWVVENVRAACDEVLVRFEGGQFPFNHPRQVERYRRIRRDQSYV
jgi:protein associated with RNAse G/E